MIFAGSLSLIVILALILEGRTIVICLQAPRAGGATRLTRLGSQFLGSEAWVIALIGISHAVYLDQFHALMHAAPVGAVSYIVGWMLRDLFLWVGPRIQSTSLSRKLIAAGAVGQTIGAATLLLTALTQREIEQTARALENNGMLLALLPPVLIVGLVAQGVLFKLPPSPYFDWSPRRDLFTI